jgi:hypothetical protein
LECTGVPDYASLHPGCRLNTGYGQCEEQTKIRFPQNREFFRECFETYFTDRSLLLGPSQKKIRKTNSQELKKHYATNAPIPLYDN